MTPPRKSASRYDSSNDVLCAEVQILAVSVEETKKGLLDLVHSVMGNGKDGMKQELFIQGQAIKSMSKKVDDILTEQKESKKEREIRAAHDKIEEEKKKDLAWLLKWLATTFFEKILSPVVVAVVLYILLNGK